MLLGLAPDWDAFETAGHHRYYTYQPHVSLAMEKARFVHYCYYGSARSKQGGLKPTSSDDLLKLARSGNTLAFHKATLARCAAQ